MRRTAFRLLAISSAAVLLTPAQARTRPRYGGTLHAETSTIVMSGDKNPDALAGLVFETLVTIDDHGQVQPALATSWTSSNGGTHWEFVLRRGVVFHDGTPFTSVTGVQSLLKLGNQPWRLRAGTDRIIFDADTSQPNLPGMLALPQFAITTTGADGTTVGTGPFRLQEHTGSLISLQANDQYWGGRPFVDSLQLLTARPLREQLTDLELERADVAEISSEQLRRAQQDRLRLDVSRPSDTLFVIFDLSKPALRDLRLRQAISLAIDRAAIRNVIFQRQGEIASGLLPNWLSGYEFLFQADQDVVRARQLRMEAGQVPPLTITYDPGDASERLVAERVALNAHDIGLNIQAVPATAEISDMRVRRLRLPSLDAPAALGALMDTLGITPASPASGVGSLYAQERAALQTCTALPLVHVPEITALKDRVRNWNNSPSGRWRFDQLWLAREARSEVRP